ncbi:TolC family outer membrane protein [Undibacterium cyanobacteriorum]|uniref:TolC family outer membrane protein n=1 Tax=Undibacterium cyanobacteriorum TaxID=3073561 RepID=A0ABY9RGT3_9BURK|nr:TolC family outer membrane protein [Undibacterium sp. 20NA77.5]WMW79452.1 TolC family outer membrane protein [Undibacterium sp. 20NA77.5]
MHIKLKQISLAISLLSLSVAAGAQVQTLKEVTQKAVSSNPEVLAKWHTFQSTASSRDAASGAYLPSVNLNADAGRDTRDNRLGKNELNRTSTSLSLNQMLFDGFLTRNQVKQLDHLKQVRLYELFDTSENITLEVVRAYSDVIRYRKLVSLSEDNYVRHRAVFEQIQAKAKAGVGRRVDLEQISGRLALAEANLITETSNLHDVSARFQRLVGVMPGKDLESLTMLTSNLPGDIVNALNSAYGNHPGLLASMENIAAVNSGLQARRSAFQPRVDLRARAERGNNIDYVSGRTNNNTAEVVMTWNLFNGGSDKAKTQEAADQVNVAKDLRDKTCRDIRQTLSIAFNDTRKLTDQLGFLDQHQLSIEKARDAYRQQFEIGQRSLLDLLDTENELFQAKRAFANAEIDLYMSYARTHAGIGQLQSTLGLENVLTKGEKNRDKSELADYSAACPAEAPNLYVANKDSLNQRALEMVGSLAAPDKGNPVVAPEPVTTTPVAPGNAPSASQIAAARTSILNALKGWREAWISMEPERYFSFYSEKYTSRESWRAARRARLMGAQKITLDLSDIKFSMQDATHAVSTFHQTYKSSSYQDELEKTIYWEYIKGKWQIVNETVSGPNARQW